MDRIKTGPNIGMIKTRSKNEVVKPKIPSSTGFSSAKNAKNTSPYKDENQTPKRTSGKGTPATKKQKASQNIPSNKVASTGATGSPTKESVKPSTASLRPPTNLYQTQ